MTDSRTAILNKLKKSASAAQAFPERVQPAFVTQADDLSQLLKQKLEAVHTSVDIVTSISEIGPSVVGFLTSHQSPLRLGLLPDMQLDVRLLEQHLKVYFCEDFALGRSVLTHASCAIAETGTVVLASSVQRPTLANFLPDNCIVLLNETDILPYLEDALSEVQNSEDGMPRALNLISGPSKTADIEQTLVYGAHGPIQLHVIIIKNTL